MKRFFSLFLCILLVLSSSFSTVSAQVLGSGSVLPTTSDTYISELTPRTWHEGSLVTISGNGFGNEIPTGGQICFTTTRCTNAESFRQLIIDWSPTQIQMQIPQGNFPSSGLFEILIPSQGQYQWISGGAYSFFSQVPEITKVELPSLVQSEQSIITVLGKHFGTLDPKRVQVCFNNVCLNNTALSTYVRTWKDDSFQFTIPAFVKGPEIQVRVFIELYTDIRTGTPIPHELSLPVIRYTTPTTVTITSLTPTQGLLPGSSIIRIIGTGFGDQFIPSLHRLCFDEFCLPSGTEASYITSWNNQEIRLRLPEAISSLENPLFHLQTYTAQTQTYTPTYAPVPLQISAMPRVQRYYPIMETGLSYSVVGVDFGSAQGSVRIGTVDMSVSTWTPTEITFRVPNHTRSGILTIHTSGGYATAPLSVEIRQVTRPTEDPLSHYQWYMEALGVFDAWKTTKGRSDVIVAVIDSAVDTTHEDLKGRLWQNPKEIPNNGIDDDANGYIDDHFGWDFVRAQAKLTPLNSHGTQVASIIAANADNEVGISGIAPGVRIMSLDITSKEADGSISVDVDAVQEAILYAVDNGASIINLSFGGISTIPIYADVLQYAYDHNVVVIAAAGNMRLNLDTTFFTPICETGTSKPSLGVASVGKDFAPSLFSNFGKRCVGISAPGEEIIGALPMSLAGEHVPYSINEGTSFAAPIVTAAAALLRSYHSDWNVEEIYTALQTSTSPIKTIRDDGFGRGVITFSTLLTQPRPKVTYTPSQTPVRPTIIPTNQRITLPDTPPQTPTPLPLEEPNTPNSIPSETTTHLFPDVASSHRYATAISSLVSQGVLEGYADGLFRPAQAINRAEFLKIIFEANGARVQDGFTNCFPDVGSEWFAKYVCLAHTLGTVQGYPDGNFKPEQPINKVEALKIMFAIYRLPARQVSIPFVDVPTNEWYTPYIQTAVALNILEEVGSTRFLRPEALVSRGMMAEMLYRLHKPSQE